MAIAYDTSTSGNVSPANATVTLAHTITGSDTVLFIAINNQNTGGYSTLTYGGVSFASNLISTLVSTGSVTSLYYIYAGAGTANIVCTRSATTGYMMVLASSYTGVNQAMSWSGGGATDAISSGNGVGASFTGSATSIADNSWAILACEFDNAGLVAGAGSVLRKHELPGYKAWGILDTNGATTPPGVINMSVSGTSGNYRYIMATISPTGSSTSVSYLSLLGVGA